MCPVINSSALTWWKIYLKKNPLQELLSSLNAVISTNESTRIITCNVMYNPAFTYKFQLKTTMFYFSLHIYSRWRTKLTAFPAKVCPYLQSKAENTVDLVFFPINCWEPPWSLTGSLRDHIHMIFWALPSYLYNFSLRCIFVKLPFEGQAEKFNF